MDKNMEVIWVKIDDIIPYENNPRKNDDAVEFVANSIKEFGFRVPITLDANNVIVTGHTRWKAAQKLGLKEVPCIVAKDLTDEQIKAYRLADNKVSEKALWDFDLLDEELEAINNIDMSMFDFTISNIDWDSIDEIHETNYEEPQHNMLECPKCHHIDRDIHFKKVKDVDMSNDELSEE